MRTSLAARMAAALVGLEGLGIGALTVREIVAIAGGDTASLESAIALVVLTLVGAAAVLAFAVAIWRGQSWGRSGGIVTQLLILAVALGAATGAFAEPGVALALAAPAVVALVLLLLAVRDAGRQARSAERTEGAAPR
ncbi:histidine kinase [Microbacterium atlanticum]|uniref:histidine kinase n=1 Tax=Microbacterium atlanticum TaxID=2782168 RepID=UPI001887BC72|nr:histidine kinase [Microbacterium atlanticum]